MADPTRYASAFRPTRGFARPGTPLISGTQGVWENVTPSGLSLDQGYSQTVGGSTDDMFGVLGMLGDQANPGVFYFFADYQGCWRTVNYGSTWTKVSGSSVLDGGKNWGPAIAPDGSYLLNCCGNNFSTGGAGSAAEVRMTIQKSTNNGQTWIKSASLGIDPYMVQVSPYDKTRAVCTFHDSDKMFESLDSGDTWVDKGQVNASLGAGAYPFYLHNSDTVLIWGADTAPSYRATKSGSTWTYTLISDLNNAGHLHGNGQVFYDSVNGAFFLGSNSVSGNDGIFKSTNNGTNWTRVDTDLASVIIGTPTTLYAMKAAPTAGSYSPGFQTSPLSPGTTWSTPTDPSGLINGPHQWATGYDGVRRVILAGCWCAGIWRYVE